MNSIANLLQIKIGNINNAPTLTWAKDLTVSVPQYLVEHLHSMHPNNSHHSLMIDSSLLTEETKQISKTALNDVRLHATFTNTQPMSSQLSINYQVIPSFVRDIVAKCIGRMKRSQVSKWAKFPAWPLDLSADFIADLGNHEPSPFATGPTPVLLTHDLDSPEGLKNAVRYFLDIEESAGARSCHYIVPSSWKIDHQLLQEAMHRGHEIGIHGFDHSNKTPFLSSAERQQRLASAKSLIENYQIHGYRAPSLLRTKGLLQDLAHLYRYDSSIPTSGGLFPIPNNGCASARPFKVEGIWEIPLSMPRDGSLLFLGYSYKEILNTWIKCAELIAQSGGVINLLTHCENRFSGKSPMRHIYREFLDYIANNNKYKFMLPKDIVTLVEGTR